MRKKITINGIAGDKPSRWSRAIDAAKRVAAVVKTVVVTTARAVVSAIKSAARTTARVTVSVAKRAASAWRVVVGPTLRSWGKWTASLAWVTAALLAPLPVISATLAAGAGMIGMGKLVERLDASGSLIARVALVLIEVVGHAVLVAFYGVVVIDAILFPPLAIVMVIDMVSRIRLARTSVEVEVVNSANVPASVRQWIPAIVDVFEEAGAVPHMSVSRVGDEPVVPGVHCAKGAEEMDELNDDKCHACGAIDTCLARSNPLPYARTPVTLSAVADPADVPAWFRRGDTAGEARVMLCGECYDAECEEIAITLTGVSLKATNVDIRLNERGLAATRALAASMERTDCLHWEATGWWRDRRETPHERVWSCFHAGRVVGQVSYAHKSRTYVAAAASRVLGSVRSMAPAKRLVNDALMDAGVVMTGMLRTLAEMAESGAAPGAVSVKAG